MDGFDLEKNIIKLAWDKRFITIKDGKNNVFSYVLRNHTIQEINTSYHIYDLSYQKALRGGLLPKEEWMGVLNERKLWTEDDNNYIKELESVHRGHLSNADEMMEINEVQSRRLYELSEKVKDKIDSHIAKRNRLMVFTAENYAEECKLIFLLECSLEDIGLNSISVDDLPNIFVFYNLLAEVKKGGIGYNEKELRYIARSSFWQNKYQIAKAFGFQLFSNSNVIELSTEQEMLMYWATVYDNINQDMEPPSREIIENDEKFDNWLERRSKKLDRERKQKASHDKFKSKGKSAFSQDEIFIKPKDEEEAKEIWELNSDNIRKRLDKKFKLAKEGITDDLELRRITGESVIAKQ